MNSSIQALNKYLASHCIDFGEKEIPNVLDFLVEQYTLENDIDSPTIRQAFSRLQPILEALPLEESDELFNAVSDICMECQRQAYLEGIRLGARLFEELSSDI